VIWQIGVLSANYEQVNTQRRRDPLELAGEKHEEGHHERDQSCTAKSEAMPTR